MLVFWKRSTWPTVHPKQNFPTIWVVTSPILDWALCNCPLRMQGTMCKHAIKVFRMINTNGLVSDIMRYADTSRGIIAKGYDTRRVNAFKWSHTAKAKRPKEHLGHVTMTKDANTHLAKIKFVPDEMEDVTKASPELRIHFSC